MQRDIPLLDTELPSANGWRPHVRWPGMYGAIANQGVIDGKRYLSAERVAMLTGRRDLSPDRNLIMPLAFHLGYHGLPIPGVLPGFGHVGLGGCFGWAILESGLSIALVHKPTADSLPAIRPDRIHRDRGAGTAGGLRPASGDSHRSPNSGRL